jgi:hypothetical protein
MCVHFFDKSHNTPLYERFERLERYYTASVYGMVESQILANLLPWVLKMAPSCCEEFPFPLCVNIHFPYALLCSILCTKLVVVLVFVWLIIESFMLALIFVPEVATNFHLLESWSVSDSLNNLPWIRFSSIFPRCLLMWLFTVALKEFSSEVVIHGCTISFGDPHELDALASQ